MVHFGPKRTLNGLPGRSGEVLEGPGTIPDILDKSQKNYIFDIFDDFRTSVLARNVKLTDPLVDLSRLLRVQLVHFLSERSVGHPGAVFRKVHFATFALPMNQEN